MSFGFGMTGMIPGESMMGGGGYGGGMAGGESLMGGQGLSQLMQQLGLMGNQAQQGQEQMAQDQVAATSMGSGVQAIDEGLQRFAGAADSRGGDLQGFGSPWGGQVGPVFNPGHLQLSQILGGANQGGWGY